MRKSLSLTALAFSLLACSTLTGGLSEPGGTARPGSTQALPPESTVTSSPTALPTLAATPTLGQSGEQRDAMRPGFEDDVSVLEGATRYVIEARVEFNSDSVEAAIQGTARIQYTHRAHEPIRHIPLMLWPNDPQYFGEATAGAALVNGELVAGNPVLGGLAVRYDLPEPIEMGKTVDLTVPFSVSAEGPISETRPRRFGISQGALFAPTFYPLVPRFVDGEWEVRQAPGGGDTTNSDIAAYWVELEVHKELVLVATGVEVGREQRSGGREAVRLVTGPVRDFAFALGPFLSETRSAGEVKTNLWILPEHQSDSDKVLDSATDQLLLLSELVGPYPYTELDIVDVPGAFGGIEYPALVTIGTLGSSWVVEPVVHEVAHQWFYGLIGDDQLEQPWMDEAFATYATSLYYENVFGQGRSTGYLSDFRNILTEHPHAETPIGMGVGDYEGRDYSLFVYLKGALFYQELRQELGDKVFFEFLQTFFQRFRYGFAYASDFQMTAEEVCECQLDGLFEEWVY